jgi:hypothetical protein
MKQTDKSNKKLSKWVNTQRNELRLLATSNAYKASPKDSCKISLLDGIGFEWSIRKTKKASISSHKSTGNGLCIPLGNGLSLPK